MPALIIQCESFSQENLRRIVVEASGGIGAANPDAVPAQVNYLASYLSHEEIDVRTIVIERPYVDRHYTEEYIRYYSNTLRPPSPHAIRLHFFRKTLTIEDLDELQRSASTGQEDYDCSRKALQQSYIGFTVVRPIPSAPIGRTILSAFRSDEIKRCYAAAATEHDVHFLGFELTVQGLPFQQQDQAVGACATTAVWSALSRVMRADGSRAPTPFAVTEAATATLLADRAIPANAGLSLEQMTLAIRALGYSPYVLKPAAAGEAFTLSVKTYLNSGIPVILVTCGEQHHALTVVGHRDQARTDDDEMPAIIEVATRSAYVLRFATIRRVYVHDDRIGPYARVRWLLSKDDDPIRLCLDPYTQPFVHWDRDQAPVWRAIVPLYPKLRLSSNDLIKLAAAYCPMARMLVPNQADKVRIELRFTLSGSYLKDLYCSEAGPRAAKLGRSVILSRYLGVISFFVDNTQLIDVICDTTDIYRDNLDPVLAVFTYPDSYVEAVQSLHTAQSWAAPVF